MDAGILMQNLFCVDSDAKVADMLRRSGKPVVLAVNKVDSIQKYMMDVYEFYTQ